MDARPFTRAAACAGLIVAAAAVMPVGTASAGIPPAMCFQSSGATFDDKATPQQEQTTTLTVGHSYSSDLQCLAFNGEPTALGFTETPTRGTTQVTMSSNMTGLDYTPTTNGPERFTVVGSNSGGSSQPVTYTATVVGGSEAQTPPTTSPAPTPVTSPAPAPAAAPASPAAPAIAFSLKGVPSGVTADSKGNVTIPISGTPGGKGTVALTATAPKASASSAAKRKKRRAKTLSLGRTSFTVPAKGVAKVKIKLSRRNFKALKKAKRLRAKVTLKSGKTPATKSLTLKAPRARK